VIMAKRQCLECGSELVMAFHLQGSAQIIPGTDGSVKSPNANWRCGTCGHTFSAENLRQGKRAKALVTEE